MDVVSCSMAVTSFSCSDSQEDFLACRTEASFFCLTSTRLRRVSTVSLESSAQGMSTRAAETTRASSTHCHDGQRAG